MAGPQQDVDTARLLSITIDALGGYLTKRIPLDASGVTLLTGANGTGKSTVLRAIDAFATASWTQLCELPIESLALETDQWTVRMDRLGPREIEFRSGHEQWKFELKNRSNWIRLWEDVVPTFDVGVWQGIQSDLAEHALVQVPRERKPHETPEWLERMTTQLSVHFVTDQRLVVNDNSPKEGTKGDATVRTTSRAVDESASSLATLMAEALGKYGVASQRADRNFVADASEVLERGRDVAVEELEALIVTATERRKKLQEVGLEPDEDYDPALKLGTGVAQEALPIVHMVLKTTLDKFEVLEPLRQRLAAFAQFVNGHLAPTGKRLVLDRSAGFIVELGHTEGTIEPKDLSSGEQQILVIAHQILFEAPRGTHLLIDEPELSLHVLWQDTFIDDITEMGKLRDLQFILATHSPTLIGARRHNRISLDH